MMRYLPQRGPMLGEAACLFDEAYQALVKAVLRLDAAELDVSEDVGAIIEDVAGLASGAVALADEYAGDVAAQLADLTKQNDGGEISTPHRRRA